LQSLLNRADKQKVELVAQLLETDWPENSDEAKFLNIYNAYLNREQVDSAGVRPLRGFTKLISSARSHTDVAEILGHIRVDTGGLFRVAIRVDPENGRGYLPSLEPARLLLGQEHRYLSDAPDTVAMRGQAVDQLAGLLRHLKRWGNGTSRVQAVLELETRLAALYPDNETLRDPSRDNLFLSLEDLERVAPCSINTAHICLTILRRKLPRFALCGAALPMCAPARLNAPRC
jgi:predicted metalloendopeptidase